MRRAIVCGSPRLAAKPRLDKDPVGIDRAMAVRKPHRRRGDDTLAAGPVDRHRGDSDVLDLAAIGAGVHPQPAADRPRDARKEFEPGDAGFGGEPRDVEMERPGAGGDGAILDSETGKAAAEADHDTRNPAVADQDIGAAADHGHRHLRRQ